MEDTRPRRQHARPTGFTTGRNPTNKHMGPWQTGVPYQMFWGKGFQYQTPPLTLNSGRYPDLTAPPCGLGVDGGRCVANALQVGIMSNWISASEFRKSRRDSFFFFFVYHLFSSLPWSFPIPPSSRVAAGVLLIFIIPVLLPFLHHSPRLLPNLFFPCNGWRIFLPPTWCFSIFLYTLPLILHPCTCV